MGKFFEKMNNTNASAARFAEAVSLCAFSGFRYGFSTRYNDIAVIPGAITMVSFFIIVQLGILLHLAILVLFVICLYGLLPIRVAYVGGKKPRERPQPL
ncbi:MAG: hypothetical protein AB7D36_05885 [Oscillospiraceae bacterium]